MARINIEASAAMAEWVDIYREHSGMGLYPRIVARAVAYLPMPLFLLSLGETQSRGAARIG